MERRNGGHFVSRKRVRTCHKKLSKTRHVFQTSRCLKIVSVFVNVFCDKFVTCFL